MIGDDQGELFKGAGGRPEGMRYQEDVITPADEAAAVGAMSELSFEPFDFHGHLAHRRVVSFGHRYDYSTRQVRGAPPLPPFLKALRERIADFAGQRAEAFEQVLINEYRPGAGIGWHRDKPQFEEVVGVSLLAACSLRFRRRDGDRWQRRQALLKPRSAYLLTGPARHLWEHSILPLDAHRFSITFRTLAITRRAGPRDVSGR